MNAGFKSGLNSVSQWLLISLISAIISGLVAVFVVRRWQRRFAVDAGRIMSMLGEQDVRYTYIEQPNSSSDF